ncbi:MAG: FAD-binding oxidoreductase [Planctomycetota bacterium]|jgi:glycolate oxidase
MDANLTESLISALGAEHVITGEDPRYYAFTFGDATMYRSQPDAVVFPGSAEEVAAVIKLAGKAKTFVVPAGGLTGLSGGAVGQGGVQLNLSRMNKVLSVDTVSKTVVAEPGISCAVLNQKLAEVGMIMPVAPASHLISTLGANIAECAGGTWGMSKGNFKNYLLTLQVVDGAGNIFETAKPFPKQSTGPDLTALFLGSEGTMGVITRVTLRCEYLPEDTWTIRACFADESILQPLHEGLAELRIELHSFEYMDGRIMQALGKDRMMLLLLQTAGHPGEAKEAAERTVELLESLHPIELKYTNDADEANELYAERRSALGALAKADPDKPVIVQFDPVLPIKRFAEGANKMRELADEAGLEIILYGHAGDGNLHPSFILHDKLEEKLKAREVIRKFDQWIEDNGGVFSGEHAVGFFLGRDMDDIRGTGEYLRKIIQAFDPNAVLNPGKIVDIDEPSLELQPVKSQYQPIADIAALCAKCHLCKLDSPLFVDEPREYNTIRGRISMIDAACRGQVAFADIKPYLEEMRPWVTEMHCPAYIKDRMGDLIDRAVAAA